jgi:hypothetical protein
MIDFSTVSREFQGLVARRREQLTFLGSVFAASGLFLQNALQGNLPPSLDGIERHLFAFFATLLLVPSFVTALRMAKLHSGMVLNGMLYARFMQDQTFAIKSDPSRASRHNFLSVSFLYFLLSNMLAGFAASLLVLATLNVGWSIFIGAAVVVLGFAFYFRFHDNAVSIAWFKIGNEECGPFTREDWEEHLARSREEANLGMLSDVAFVGLFLFSAFEVLSSLGRIDPTKRTELDPVFVETTAPGIYSTAVVIVCLVGLLTNLRVRIAIGFFSLQLDPTDRPFRTLRLTDSLLGYMLIAFLFTVSLHVLLVQLIPGAEGGEPWLLGIDASAFVFTIVAEQLTLLVADRKIRRYLFPPPLPPSPPPSPVAVVTDGELAGASSGGPSP